MLTAYIVDDNPGDRALIRKILRDCPIASLSIEESWNLEDTVDRLRSPGIDILLLDLNLPGSRGVETVSRVRAVSPDTPIIVVTGSEDQHTAAETVGQGAQGHLVKGRFDAKMLTGEILRCLEGKPGNDRLSATGVPSD